MTLNWKENLKKKSNTVLFNLFSETKRMNITPQIYAGNLLFERGFNLPKLLEAKNALLQQIEVDFNNRYYKDPRKIIRENILSKLVLCGLWIAPLIMGRQFVEPDFSFSFLNLNTLLLLISVSIFLMQFINIKQSNLKALKKVRAKRKEKNELIDGVRKELKF